MNGPIPPSDGSDGDTDDRRIVVPLWRAPLAGHGLRTESHPGTRSDRQGFRAAR